MVSYDTNLGCPDGGRRWDGKEEVRGSAQFWFNMSLKSILVHYWVYWPPSMGTFPASYTRAMQPRAVAGNLLCVLWETCILFYHILNQKLELSQVHLKRSTGYLSSWHVCSFCKSAIVFKSINKELSMFGQRFTMFTWVWKQASCVVSGCRPGEDATWHGGASYWWVVYIQKCVELALLWKEIYGLKGAGSWLGLQLVLDDMGKALLSSSNYFEDYRK